MPLRWSHKPDPKEPDYRRLGDRLNFVVHVAFFAALNSGLWFVRELQMADWQWVLWITLGWMGILSIHGTYVFTIANYAPLDCSSPSTTSKGFGQTKASDIRLNVSKGLSSKGSSRGK